MELSKQTSDTVGQVNRARHFPLPRLRWLDTLAIQAEHHLEELVYHIDDDTDIHPSVHLYILVDQAMIASTEIHMIMTDLAHTCLTNFFRPHGQVGVSWVQREQMKHGTLEYILQKHTGCNSVESYRRASGISRNIEDVSAILLLSPDAKTFMDAHKDTFLDTLADCLIATRKEIVQIHTQGRKPLI